MFLYIVWKSKGRYALMSTLI